MNWTDVLVVYFAVAIVLDHAHLACPIWLGWSNRGFREYMLSHAGKFIWLPALCVGAAVVVGLGSSTTREPAFRTLALVYFWWNAWHFGSQHYGIACLLGWRSGSRWARQAVIVLPTMALILTPHPIMLLPLIAAIDLAHWTADIGLTMAVIRRWWWLAAVLAVGMIGFLWKGATTDPQLCGGLPACSVVRSVPLLLSIRIGLGFWHFLMSRWVWKFSDPQVRETIRCALVA